MSRSVAGVRSRSAEYKVADGRGREVGGQIQVGYVIPFVWIVADCVVDVVNDELVRDHNVKPANPSCDPSAGPDVDEISGPEMINHILRRCCRRDLAQAPVEEEHALLTDVVEEVFTVR